MTIAKHWEELTMSTAPDEVVNEFIKKYKGSYLWFQAKDSEPILCLARGTDEDREDRTFVFQSVKFGTLTCRLNSDVVLQAKFPPLSLFNLGEKSMGYLYRIPARQYRKAPTKENCYLSLPYETFQEQIKNPPRNYISESNLIYAFASKYSTYDVALWGIEQDLFNSRALSRWFGISKGIDGSNKKLLFWYLDRPIGYIMKDKIELKVPELLQEVQDFIKRNNIQATLQ